MHKVKKLALLSVDFEDYRRQQLRDHLDAPQLANPKEVERQLDILLELFGSDNMRATFFSVGRLTKDLSHLVWQRIVAKHQLGCHGHEHNHVRRCGQKQFREDLHSAKAALEDASGQPVVSYRAPYFSSDGCDPWFGQELARAGFKIDSSRRINSIPDGFTGTIPVVGAEQDVIEVPLPSIGFGPKRITIIGGTYFRLLPLSLIRRLLLKAEQQGFIPSIYLHPYDVDPMAEPLEYPKKILGHQIHRGGDYMRRMGRKTAGDKLRALAQIYKFQPVELMLKPQDVIFVSQQNQ